MGRRGLWREGVFEIVMPDPIRAEFVALVVGLSGWPFWYYVGLQMGRATAPRRIVNIDGLRKEWAQTVEVAPEPDLIERAPGSYARFSWRRLSRRQWRALLETTAEGKLCGADKPFSKSELAEVRDLFIKRGVARWRNPEYPQQGWELVPCMWRGIVRHTGGNLPYRNRVTREA